jgi:hypothetical protein
VAAGIGGLLVRAADGEKITSEGIIRNIGSTLGGAAVDTIRDRVSARDFTEVGLNAEDLARAEFARQVDYQTALSDAVRLLDSDIEATSLKPSRRTPSASDFTFELVPGSSPFLFASTDPSTTGSERVPIARRTFTADGKTFKLISSILAGVGKVEIGKAYRYLDGISVNLEPISGDFENLPTYEVSPGIGVNVSIYDGTEYSTDYGIFTDKTDGRGGYYLRQATEEEVVGIQVAVSVDGKQLGKQLLVGGGLYYALGALDAAITLRPSQTAKIDPNGIAVASAAADAEAGGASLVGVPASRSVDPYAPVREFDVYRNENYYRSMRPDQARELLLTGRLPATGETSLSTSAAYADFYIGVTVRITVERGTAAEINKIAIAANKAAAEKFPNLVEKDGFGDAARIKVETRRDTKGKVIEGPIVTTQLGKGKALDLFNSRLVKVEVVRSNTDRRLNPITTRQRVRELSLDDLKYRD